LGKPWGDTERRVGADVTLAQSWTTAGRLTTQSLTSTSGATGADHHLQHRTYAYRADGHLTEIRELTSGTRRFDPDGIGRVDSESEAGGLALAEEIAVSWRRCLSETFPDRAFTVVASATEDGPVVSFVTIR
jgi:hypothetical protein